MRPALLFLDFDGVLNHVAWFKRRAALEPVGLFDPACVHRVGRICLHFDAEIVISSSWRGAGEESDLLECRAYLRGAGLSLGVRVIGLTPVLSDRASPGSPILRGVRRSEEISAFLATTPARSYVVIDDDEDAKLHPDRFVRTEHEHGLTEANAEEAIAKFRQQLR